MNLYISYKLTPTNQLFIHSSSQTARAHPIRGVTGEGGDLSCPTDVQLSPDYAYIYYECTGLLLNFTEFYLLTFRNV